MLQVPNTIMKTPPVEIEFCVSLTTDPMDGNGNNSLIEIRLNALKMFSGKMKDQ